MNPLHLEMFLVQNSVSYIFWFNKNRTLYCMLLYTLIIHPRKLQEFTVRWRQHRYMGLWLRSERTAGVQVQGGEGIGLLWTVSKGSPRRLNSDQDRQKAAPTKSSSMCDGQFKKEAGMGEGLRAQWVSTGNTVQQEIGGGERTKPWRSLYGYDRLRILF